LADNRDVDFRILGPLEVVDASGPVEISGTNTRAVLADLLLNADRPVTTGSLVATVWGGSPPESAPAMLRNAISQLRRQLGDAIETTPGGYRLHLGTHTLDAQRFTELVAAGREASRAGEAARASDALGEALALWRGRPLDGVARNGEFDLRTNELEELRRAATLDRIDADLELGGRENEIVIEVGRLIEDDPYNERLRGQLMIALYRAGRQADALTAYQEARRALASDLGLEPGDALRELERRILQHDPRLKAQRRAPQVARRTTRWNVVAALAVVAAVVAAVVVLTRVGGAAPVIHVPPSSLALVDATSGDVSATPGLGGSPTAVTTDARGAWAATANQTLVRVSGAGDVIETFGVGFVPVDLATFGGTVWASSRGYLGRVTRLQHGRLTSYSLPQRVRGRELRVAADAGGAWVGDGDSGIYRLDGATARLVATAPDGLRSPHGGELAIGANSVWVSDASHDGVVTRLDPVTGGEVASITLPLDAPSNGPATFGANALWTVSRGETTLWRIDADANTISQTVRVGIGTTGLAFAGGAIWTVNDLDKTLRRIDPVAARVTATWRFSRAPVGVAAAAGRVWVAFG
jgi:DNA-binding SARP family transcriptional activator